MMTSGTLGEETIRLGMTFHRTFSLVRSAVSEVVALAVRLEEELGQSRCLDRETVRARTNLGSIYVEAMPRYGYGTGLLDARHCLTAFGRLANAHDLLLDMADSQWLMHYHLSAPHGPGPAFWHDVVASHFRPGDEFTTEDIAAHIADFVARREGRALAARSARSTATVLLGTYTKPDGLEKLGLLEKMGNDRYRVLESEPPPQWAFGCALLDYWQAHFGDRLTVNLDELSSERGLGCIFLIGAGRLNTLLRELQGEGYVDVYRVAPPYQVVLLRRDADSLLRRMYGNNDSA